MAFFLKICDRLSEEEDDQLMNVLYDTYWILPQVSMTFPSWKRSCIPLSVSLFIFHSFALTFHAVILAISIVRELIEGNWELLCLSLHYEVLLLFSIFIATFVNSIRKNNASQHRRLAQDIGIYTSGRIYDEKWCLDEKKRIRMEKVYLLFIPVLIAATGGLVLVVPYLAKWYTSGSEQPYTPSGINTNLPISAWYPVPTHEGILHIVAVGGQLMCCGSMALIITTTLYMMIHFSLQLKYELSIIGYSLKCLFSRSLRLYHLKNPEKRGREDIMNFQRVVGLCLRDSIIHHQNVTEMISTYQDEASMPVAVAYMTGVLAIGMSLYNILMALDADNYGSIITFSFMVITEILTMFMLSLHGATLTAASESLRHELYFMEWHNLDVRNRKIFLNFQTVITEPVVIKAGGIVNISMDTFTSILNSAYSFFNVMNA